MKISLVVSSLTAVALSAPSLGAVKAIYQTDFNSLTLGAVQTSTQYTAGTPGQGNWITDGGGNTFYNIAADPVTSGTRGKNMSIQGGTSSTSRFAWQSGGVTSGWNARDAGSDEIWAVWDQNTLNSNTSTNRFGLVIYDASRSKILTGLVVEAHSGKLYGLAYSTSATSTLNGIYGLTSSSGFIAYVSTSAWQSLAVSFNKTTGRAGFHWKTSGGSWDGNYVDGAAAGVDPSEFGLYESSNFSNSQGKAHYDNILVCSAGTAFVPAPGAAALVGVASFLTSRRRR